MNRDHSRAVFRVGSSLALALALLVTLLPGTVLAGSDKEKPGQIVSEVFVSVEELRDAGLLVDSVDPDPGITPQWGCVVDCWHLKNVVYTGETNSFVTQVKGNPGPMTLTLSQTRTVSNSFSATVGIKASVVTAEIGFSVTWSASQQYQASINVPSGACRILKAYNTYKNYRYEIWDQNFIGDPFKVGSGTAKKFIGVLYTQVTC